MQMGVCKSYAADFPGNSNHGEACFCKRLRCKSEVHLHACPEVGCCHEIQSNAIDIVLEVCKVYPR